MRIAFVIVLSVMSVLLIGFILYFSRRKDPLKELMLVCFICAFIVMIANIFMAITHNEIVSLIAHTSFFMAMGVLCLFFMIFCIKYTSKRSKVIPIIFTILEGLDLLNLFVNLFTKHAFTIVPIDSYYTFKMNDIFIIYGSHLIVCYIMIGIGLIFLLIKTVLAQSIYKLKYIYIVITFIIGLFLDALYLFFNSVVNWSIVVFPIICIGSYYFASIFVPRMLHNKTLGYVVNTMESGLVAFDKDEELAFMNDYFKEYFKLSNERDVYNLLKEWTNLPLIQTEIFEKTIDINEDRYYKLQFNKFMSKKNEYLGAFFVITDITKDIIKLQEENYKATHDELTGLYNLEFFYMKAEERMKANPNTKYTILITDIGNFKLINEISSIETGDFILKQFGEFFRTTSSKDSVYGRIKSDVFAIMLPSEQFDEEYYLDSTQKIMDSLDDNLSRFFTCYLAVYDLNENIYIRNMCDRAILSLKEIKGTTKRIVHYKEETSEMIILEQELTGQVEDAIKNKDITLFIQPQTTKDGAILGGECLVRWIHPEKGFLSPGVFVPLFERNGKITDVDLYIWECACKLLASWKDTPLKDIYLSVNISPVDIISLDIYDTFIKLTEKYQINPKLLKLEITESAVMESVEKTEELIEKLHKAGFIVEMDDFGAGYSSLNTLKDLSVDTIKLDMAFLKKSLNDIKSKTIIKSIISLASELNIEVISEGVETKDHVDFIAASGCIHFQGYYFYKPMPYENFEKILKQN